jgi:hypothetical protein
MPWNLTVQERFRLRNCALKFHSRTISRSWKYTQCTINSPLARGELLVSSNKNKTWIILIRPSRLVVHWLQTKATSDRLVDSVPRRARAVRWANDVYRWFSTTGKKVSCGCYLYSFTEKFTICWLSWVMGLSRRPHNHGSRTIMLRKGVF